MALIQQKNDNKKTLTPGRTFLNLHGARFIEFSSLDYKKAWGLQKAIVDAKINKTLNDDVVLCLEHPPVFTIGRNATLDNLLVSEAFLAEKDIKVIQVERGGDITYHGPGQLVVYPVVDLNRAGLGVREFVEKLEEIMLRTSKDVGVCALRNSLNRGVWVGKKKIGSVGIAIRKGIAFHGFALNVNLFIGPFQWIHPCGLGDISVTTLADECSRFVAMDRIRNIAKKNIQDVLGIELICMKDSRLIEQIGKAAEQKEVNNLTSKTAGAANRKPRWLKRRLPTGPEYETVRSLIRDNRLHTVCRQAKCPNQFECYSKKTATFLILGHKCTRNCRFCAIEYGPQGLPDAKEPQRVADAAKSLQLDYVVVTSVTRDDLSDGGAGIFAETIRALKKNNPDVLVEVLIPDFQGDPEALRAVLNAQPDVLNHNIETVPRLYKEVRPEAEYHRSIWILKHASSIFPDIVIKSGLMLGLGETGAEIENIIQELHDAGCNILTIGQYLQPSKGHLKVERYIHPNEFNMWREKALDAGFSAVASGPFVRSSYHAREMFPAAANYSLKSP